MRATMIDASGFARLVAEAGLGFATTDELVGIADTNHVWTDLLESKGMMALKRSIIRRIMRQKVYDEDGNRIEWVNIIQTDRKGKTKQVYKQLALLTMNDYEQVIRDRRSRVEKFEAEFRRFCKLALRQFGDRIQKRFDFDLAGED